MKPVPLVAAAVLAFAVCFGDVCAGPPRPAPASQPAARSTTRPASRRSGAGGFALVEVRSNESFVHESTGFVFPPTVGSFRRVRVGRLGDAGQAVTVRYKDPDLKISLAIAVYAGEGI